MTSSSLRACCRLALGAAALGLAALPVRADAADSASDADADADADANDGLDASPPPAVPARFGHRPPRHEHRLALGTGALVELSSPGQGAADIGGNDVHSDPQLSAAFGSQLTSQWLIGLRLAYATRPYFSDVRDHSLWQLAAEARWQPEGELGPYAIASAGGMAAVDDSGGVSAWHLAPAIGGALGFDVALSGPVTLGFELRALGAVSRDETESFGAERTDPSVEYELSSWLGLNVIATLGIGERDTASLD
jgi:hypothetical protein